MGMRVLSLGAGVQSTALLLMVCEGELEAERAIFADTGWEPQVVYRHLEWLEKFAAERGVIVERVNNGNLRADLMASGDGKGFASIPLHVRTIKGNVWTPGMARRQCTSQYKIRPLQRRIRELGATAKRPTSVLMGISTDEALRAKPSRVKYCINEFPLIERGMSRKDCLKWIADRGLPAPPKSACIGCPFHDRAGWAQIKSDPEAWADAVEVDGAIRKVGKFNGEAYLHRSLKPLAEVDLTDPDTLSHNLFENECEGMCGV